VSFALFIRILSLVVPPGWPAKFTINPALAYTSSAALIIACLAIFFQKKVKPAALLIAILIFLFSVLRHLPHFMNDWVNGFKAIALVGGAFIIAASFFKEDHFTSSQTSINESRRKNLVIAGSVLIAAFFIACGYAHFKWANGVQYLIPAYIPFRLFWVYFCGLCLFAGGAGILIPQTKKWAAMLSGIMILGWFILLHIPRFAANPGDPSDRMGLCESFAFSGICFVLAGMFWKKK